MQREIAALALAFTSAFGVVHAQSEVNANSTRILHASTDGLLTDTLTLAADTGQPRVIASEPYLLMAPRADDYRLRFQVKMQRPDGPANLASFEVTRIAPDKATIHCVSCGFDAPVVTPIR